MSSQQDEFSGIIHMTPQGFNRYKEALKLISHKDVPPKMAQKIAERALKHKFGTCADELKQATKGSK